jgi:nicotinamide mononucleotide transporter
VREVLILVLIGAAATAGMREYFIRINDSAPFLDALTTVLSLLAQYLLNCKRIENWFVWITADVLYIWLYTQKGLYLTAVLYTIFIGMCIAGLLAWRKSLRQQSGKVCAA